MYFLLPSPVQSWKNLEDYSIYLHDPRPGPQRSDWLFKSYHWLMSNDGQIILCQCFTLLREHRNGDCTGEWLRLNKSHGLCNDIMRSISAFRSSGTNILCELKARTKSAGDKAFQNAAPQLWKKHPSCIQQRETLLSFKGIPCSECGMHLTWDFCFVHHY